MTRTQVGRKTWTEPHPARFGAPAGQDDKIVLIETQTVFGRVYQLETHVCNGTVTYSAQYPAGTAYAAKRLALVAA